VKELEIVAKELLEKEIIFQSDLERLIGKRPFEKETTYQEFTNGTMDARKAAKRQKDKKKETAELEAAMKSEVEESAENPPKPNDPEPVDDKG
jgi:AFG3 family protein